MDLLSVGRPVLIGVRPLCADTLDPQVNHVVSRGKIGPRSDREEEDKEIVRSKV